MVRLNVIYTRTGDRGETGLGDGSRRPKTDARVAAMGDVDEANCAVGLARLSTRGAADPTLASIEPTLARIQNDLFDLGADLCLPRRPDEAPGAALRVAPSQVEALERAIDALNARLEPLRSFVLPGGSAAAAALHHARAVCRRAERSLVALAAIEGETVGEAALAYVNRLSDYLFVAARAANDFGRADVLWAPGASQSETQMSERSAADRDRRHQRHVDGRNRRRADPQRRRGAGRDRPGRDLPLPGAASRWRCAPWSPTRAKRKSRRPSSSARSPTPMSRRSRPFSTASALPARASRSSACTARPFCTGRARASPASSATARARPLSLGDRRRLRLPLGRCRGRRRRRAARADLSCGDDRRPRASADGPQLGRGRQRHLSRRDTARSSPSTPGPPMR